MRGETKKEGKNKAVEMLTFSESRGCAKSSNDQQVRSNQASASPEILITLRSHPYREFVLGAATKLNGKVDGA